ncbi:MAG: hypothetical protein KAR73_15020 [Spirochaetales bacterium]|nr:hypothetical protein [Spirochaetales bacterium]
MTALYWIDTVALFAATGAFWAVSSLLLRLPLPILSITNTISVSLIGYGVISRQLFNPLREREARLLVINRIAAAVGI